MLLLQPLTRQVLFQRFNYSLPNYGKINETSTFKAARSGRLYIVRFPESMPLDSCFEQAEPGSLGMSLYTYKVSDIEDYSQRIKGSKVKRFSEIEVNEFGEKSFSFVAPDGYFWTLLSS